MFSKTSTMTEDDHHHFNDYSMSPTSTGHSEMLRQEPPLLSDETPIGEFNNYNNNNVHYPDDLLHGINDGVPKHRLNDLCAAIFSREGEFDFNTNDSTMPGTMDNDLGPTADVVRSSTLDDMSQSSYQVPARGNGPDMKLSHDQTKNHRTPPSSRGGERHYAHLSPPSMYPYPFMLFNGGHPMPPPHHHAHHLPYPFHHHPDAYSSMYDRPAMECEVYDVDNEVVVTEQQRPPSRRAGVPSPSHKTRPSFVSGDIAPGGGYYPSSFEFGTGMASPYQSLPSMQPAMPADSNQVPEGFKTGRATTPGAHPPVLIQTGLGPALLLHPSAMTGPVPMTLPLPTDIGSDSSQASSVNVASPARNSAKATKNTSGSSSATTVEVMDTRFQRWTEAEDQLLVQAAKEQGGPPYNWNRIAAKCFPSTRTGPQCKARWKKALKPGLKRGNWEPEEDRLILELHEEGLKWTEIAERIPGRVPDHIRQRFMNALDPQKKKTPWTQKENQVLYQAQKRLGNKWSEISKLLPGRSENDIKNRWHNAKMAQRRKMRRIAKESARRTVVSKTTVVVQPPTASGASFDGSSESQEFLQVDDDDDSIGSLA